MDNAQIIEKVFHKATSTKDIYEAVILAESKKGDFSVDFGHGGRDINSPMFTASVGKLFVTTCIMILEGRGKLSLDDLISKYITKPALSSKLTISHLLFQTSGIPDWLAGGRDKKVFVEGDLLLSFEEKLASIKDDKSHFNIGEKTHYSDTNFCILGKVIENITEKPLATVCDEWIFKPLGLSKTYLPTSKDNFVTNIYHKENSLHRPNAMISASGSGDGMTTARELMVFLKAFFGGTFFPKSNFKDLTKYGKLQITMGGAWYGGGFMRIPLGVARTLFMGKGELLGHTGATGSFAFYYPHKDLFFVGDFNQAARPGLPIMAAVSLATKLK